MWEIERKREIPGIPFMYRGFLWYFIVMGSLKFVPLFDISSDMKCFIFLLHETEMHLFYSGVSCWGNSISSFLFDTSKKNFSPWLFISVFTIIITTAIIVYCYKLCSTHKNLSYLNYVFLYFKIFILGILDSTSNEFYGCKWYLHSFYITV